MTIINQEALNNRAKNLKVFNGLKLTLVTLPPGDKPIEAYLEVHFYNKNELQNILDDIKNTPKKIKEIFSIEGGHRIPAGEGTGEVQVTHVTGNDTFLKLTVAPVGDYSTYTLKIDYTNFDPFLSQIDFKFRPQCFSNNCAPEWEPAPKPMENPRIDYMAKDYDSFRHTMIAAMMHRVPGWEATSEADMDMVLLELFSTAADELSDYQDRVMNEAYWSSARKRVSLARYARLMNYHIHQGNQASTMLVVELKNNQTKTLPKEEFEVWTGGKKNDSESQVFITKQEAEMHYLLNRVSLYTWSDAVPALKTGSTSADLKLIQTTQNAAKTVESLIHEGKVTHLLIQEWLNPNTGGEAGRNPEKRQILQLKPGKKGAKAKYDPVDKKWYVQVYWEERDQLKHNYCFTIKCDDPVGKKEDVSLFHGNLVQVYHGLSNKLVFKEPGEHLTENQQLYFERTEEWGTLCPLYKAGRLAYEYSSPGGEAPSLTTLVVKVKTVGTLEWEEVPNLVHSQEDHEHYMVETDELGRSWIRFGNGVNGMALPKGAEVECTFQVGKGRDGNIGRDRLINFNSSKYGKVKTTRNPFDVTNGRDPEPLSKILRHVPEAYQDKQLRAVTLDDYVKRTEELPEVSKAAARYLWTGSWRTVRVTVDPTGTTELTEKDRLKIARYLEVVRLIGEDLEIRPPRFVPLKIKVKLCIHPDFWIEDIRFILEQEFSESYTPDGPKGFFHPDCWTFGQSLQKSQIVGRVQAVQGVSHVLEVKMERWNESTPGIRYFGFIEVAANEVIRVKNDPDNMEKGSIIFDIRGGRR